MGSHAVVASELYSLQPSISLSFRISCQVLTQTSIKHCNTQLTSGCTVVASELYSLQPSISLSFRISCQVLTQTSIKHCNTPPVTRDYYETCKGNGKKYGTTFTARTRWYTKTGRNPWTTYGTQRRTVSTSKCVKLRPRSYRKQLATETQRQLNGN